MRTHGQQGYPESVRNSLTIRLNVNFGLGGLTELFCSSLWQHAPLQNKTDNGLQPYPVIPSGAS